MGKTDCFIALFLHQKPAKERTRRLHLQTIFVRYLHHVRLGLSLDMLTGILKFMSVTITKLRHFGISESLVFPNWPTQAHAFIFTSFIVGSNAPAEYIMAALFTLSYPHMQIRRPENKSYSFLQTFRKWHLKLKLLLHRQH